MRKILMRKILMKRLVFALSRNDVKFAYEKTPDQPQPEYVYKITISSTDGTEIGFINSDINTLPEKTTVFVRMLRIYPPYRKTKAVIYLLEEFKKFLDTLENPEVSAIVEHPELEEWLQKYIQKYDINFVNQNPNQGLGAMKTYISFVIHQYFQILDYDVPLLSRGENELTFKAAISLKAAEDFFTQRDMGNSRQYKKYMDHGIKNLTAEDITKIALRHIRNAMSEFLMDNNLYDYDWNKLNEYFDNVQVSSFSIHKEDDQYVINFSVPAPEASILGQEVTSQKVISQKITPQQGGNKVKRLKKANQEWDQLLYLLKKYKRFIDESDINHQTIRSFWKAVHDQNADQVIELGQGIVEKLQQIEPIFREIENHPLYGQISTSERLEQLHTRKRKEGLSDEIFLQIFTESDPDLLLRLPGSLNYDMTPIVKYVTAHHNVPQELNYDGKMEDLKEMADLSLFEYKGEETWDKLQTTLEQIIQNVEVMRKLF